MSKVKHIALLKFKDGTSEEQINKLFDDLLDLSETVEGIEDYVSGDNNSPEGKSAGYTHGFIITFSDAAARDAYLSHPDHQKFQAAAEPIVESVVVVDFEV
jgi:quinol monooxygenase YgiN